MFGAGQPAPLFYYVGLGVKMAGTTTHFYVGKHPLDAEAILFIREYPYSGECPGSITGYTRAESHFTYSVEYAKETRDVNSVEAFALFRDYLLLPGNLSNACKLEAKRDFLQHIEEMA